MLAETLASRLAARGIHYAWVVVAVTFMTSLTMSGALGLPGAMLAPIAREFGWNYEQISGALALRFVLFGLMAPFSAAIIGRFGVRPVMLGAVTLVAGGMLLATRVTALWQLVILWGILLGLGSGLAALVLGAIVANRWFTKRRGLVVGVFSAATSTGQLAFLPLAAWLIQHFGWRAAVIPMSCAVVVVGVSVLCFMRDQPSDLGLVPFGEPAGTVPAPDPTALVRPTIRTPFVALAQASRVPTFWFLFGTFFICGLSTNGLVQTHFISLCGDYGLTVIPAASELAAMGAFDIVGTVLSGWLSDRWDNRLLLFWYYALRGLSLFWLPNSGFTLIGLSVFAMFYGLDWIATVPPTVRLTTVRFGKERAAAVFGWIFAGHQIGAATGAFGAGLVRTYYFSYAPALYYAATWCLLAAVVALLIARPNARAAQATA